MGLDSKKNYEFITILRGGAAIAVVISHLVMMYYNGAASATFSYLLPVQGTEPRLLQALSRLTVKLNFNFGAFGVSIFFLISGFLVSNSLKNKTGLQFLKKRVCRVYPVYAAGFTVTFALIWLYTRFFAGTDFPYGWKDWLLQVSLLRDWFWVPSIDGVSWTLETDLKFYIFAIALLHMDLLQNPKGLLWAMAGISLLSIACAKASLMPGLSLYGYAFFYFLSFGCCGIIYICIGICLFNWFSSHWSVRTSFLTGAAVYCLFILTVKNSVWSSIVGSTIPNYTYGLVVFLLAAIFSQKLPRLRPIRYISKISFSLYIVHGLNGYMLLSVLDHWGLHPYLAIGLAILITTALAMLLYKTVEEPLKNFKMGCLSRPRARV